MPNAGQQSSSGSQSSPAASSQGASNSSASANQGQQQGGGAQSQQGDAAGDSNSAGGQKQYGAAGSSGQGQQSAQGQAPYDDVGGFDSAQGSAGTGSDIDFSEGASGNSTASTSAAGNSGTEGQAGGLPLPSASSYEERVAVLDRQLEGSMSDYDGMILRERRNIHNRADAMGSEQQVETFDRNVAYYDEGDLSGEGGDEGQQGAGGNGGLGDDQSPQVAQAGGHPNGSNAGGPGRANDRAYAPPSDIPSGDDDDVVARQIREAAMYEDDPELREKLWEEYRKYKEQTR